MAQPARLKTIGSPAQAVGPQLFTASVPVNVLLVRLNTTADFWAEAAPAASTGEAAGGRASPPFLAADVYTYSGSDSGLVTSNPLQVPPPSM